jgi:hypothetical protein
MFKGPSSLAFSNVNTASEMPLLYRGCYLVLARLSDDICLGPEDVLLRVNFRELWMREVTMLPSSLALITEIAVVYEHGPMVSVLEHRMTRTWTRSQGN